MSPIMAELIFAGTVAVATVFYAVLTWKLVRETRSLREVQTEPKLHVILGNHDSPFNLVRLRIENIGLGPARDLQLNLVVESGGREAEKMLEEFTEPNFFKTGFRHFGPGQSVFSGFTNMTEGDFDAKLGASFLLSFRYESATGKEYKEEFVLNMIELKGSYQLGEPSQRLIAKSLDGIDKNLGYLITGFKRIKADVYSMEDRKLSQDFEKIGKLWPRIMDQVKVENPRVAKALSDAKLEDLDGEILVLRFSTEDSFRRCQYERSLTVMEESLSAVMRKSMRIRCEFS